MLILVDYDNIPYTDRTVGLDHVIRKLLSLLSPLPKGVRPRVRLYGGWYEAGRMTRRAQSLVAEIRSNSPVRVVDTDSSVLLVDVELVYSSLVHPKVVIGNTFREQSIRDGIRCQDRPWLQCADNNDCPIASVLPFFRNNLCSHSSCSVRPPDLLTRMEQKIVDTTMVADLAYAHQQNYSDLCVVSRDDDIWPGLCLAALNATKLIHVSTGNSQRMPDYFRAIASPPYQFILWS